MTILPDQLQLLLDRQQQRFRESHLSVLDNLLTRLLNLPCFGDVKEIDELISHLHTELENDCRTYEYENKSLYESLMISNANEAVAHDPSSDPEMSNSEACPVVGSNPTVPETCTDSEASSSQEERLVPENVSHASNNGQKSNTNFKDAVYFSDLLSTDGILKRSGEYVPQESNLNDLISSVADTHHLVSSSGPSTQCGKYALNRIRLTVTWVYEDPTLFRGGGRTQKILKIRISTPDLQKRGVRDAGEYTNHYHVKSNDVLGL
ncbi:hypothetical protein MS3_00008140 [Schistosoma haematobium]|uniref:Uncharacterized protein n=1 Tax=Schistosoma haematobium TaxID=6185 RepID=A0A922IP83_SCHHA|nr:hypothetical protein MS3_00008140 [Schistosoma haematobium]KAH9583871.1 hypothetical protein MS3_00008140 [Schistosoma haematobium]